MAKRNGLLPRLRSRNHVWFLRAAGAGGAVVASMIAAGPLLAATHVKQHPRELWEIALIVVVGLAALGVAALVIGGVGAFLTRPVPPDHASTIKASAQALARSLESGKTCDYGDSYKPDQAFCAHFPKLGERLMAWDELVAAPVIAAVALDRNLDALMAEHKVADGEADVGYNVPEIKKYARGLVMALARGQLQEAPHLEWAGFTTAGGGAPGPPAGLLRTNGSMSDWISLTPLDGETASKWNDRAGLYRDRVDAVLGAVHESALPYAQAILDAEQRLEDFKRDELPAILDALQLVHAREAPRARPHRCESC